MPPENESIDSWSGASREEIILLVAVVAFGILLAVLIQVVRGWLARRREMRVFFSIVDSRHLSEQEEDAVRQLAAEGNLPHPSEILTSIATFDTLAEAALREGIEEAGRPGFRGQMESLYSARAKLFPQEPLPSEPRSPGAPAEKRPQAPPGAGSEVPPGA